jgi:hypothetical protein
MKPRIPDWLTLLLWHGLIGEIYPSIRAIAIALSKDKTLLIRYYLDREPTDEDFESMEIVATNVSSAIGSEPIEHIDIDCQMGVGPIGNLDTLEGLIYCRNELMQ